MFKTIISHSSFYFSEPHGTSRGIWRSLKVESSAGVFSYSPKDINLQTQIMFCIVVN